MNQIKYFSILMVFMAVLLTGCRDNTPPDKPEIYGVKEGEIYGSGVTIRVSPQEGVEYTATIDGLSYELGELFDMEGVHTLEVIAVKTANQLVSSEAIEFEIDRQKPPQPEISGVEMEKTYDRDVVIRINEVEGVEYTVTINGVKYTPGERYGSEGNHILEVTALRKRNGLTATTTVNFSIDKDTYTQKEIDYFMEIAFGSEFGGEVDRIRKWAVNPRIKVYGTPSSDDIAVLKQVIQDFNHLSNDVKMEVVKEDENLKVYFIPHAKFVEYVSREEAESNWGLFLYYEDGQGQIDNAKILIAIDRTSQEERNHLIREELTQAMGLGNDSMLHKDSIFYQNWSTLQKYSELDQKLISMLYNKDIMPGAKRKEITKYFEDKLADTNEREQIYPVDESVVSKEFMVFREELVRIVENKDVSFLLDIIDDDLTYPFLEYKGAEAFRLHWGLDQNSNQSLVWSEMADILNLGGTFKDEEKNSFTAPYTYSEFPFYFDRFNYGIIVEKDIELHEKPDITSEVLAELSYDIVKLFSKLEDDDLSIESQIKEGERIIWYHVATLSGEIGYIDAKYLRRPTDYRIGFVKKNNEWKIAFFEKDE